jgi:hypothetical protein
VLATLDATGNLTLTGAAKAPTGFYTGAANTTPVSWIGEIRIHSGSLASIPTGWHLCDGTNGTPDLRDRFVVGAGNSRHGGDMVPPAVLRALLLEGLVQAAEGAA